MSAAGGSARAAEADRIRGAHRYWLEEFFRGGDRDDLERVFSADVTFQHHGGADFGQGLRGIRAMLKVYRTAFPDIRLSVKSQHVAEDVVTSCFLASGTHRGVVWGIQPTGRRVWTNGVEIARFEGGKIVEASLYIDAFTFLLQVRDSAYARLVELSREGFPSLMDEDEA